MKRLLILFSVLLVLIPVTTSYAQDALEVGEAIRGEITNSAFEVEYTFSGTADSVVIIEMAGEDDDGFMNDLDAQLILLDADGSVVSDTADNFSFDAVLVTQLPADGDYTVIATRTDGRSGDTEGEYTLRLSIPDVLALGDKLEGSTTSEAGVVYYVINSEDDFVLGYTKSAGDFNPEVMLSTITDNNSDMEDYASVTGKVTNAALGDIPAGLYVVSVAEALFDFNFDEVTADYSISVNALDG